MATDLKLYVKVWCPWCIRAEEWLRSHGFRFEQIDVEASRAAYDEMIRLSGQRLTPTMTTGSGLVLADFGPEELQAFVRQHHLQP